MTSEEIKPVFKYIKIDETRFWNISILRKIATKWEDARVIVTYIFNASEETNCCELIPSYWLEYAGTEFLGDKELSEDDREYIDSLIMSNMSDEDSHYRHCSKLVDAPLCPSCGGAETLEEVREWYQGNPW